MGKSISDQHREHEIKKDDISNDDALKTALKKAILRKSPVFKICSSKYHRNNYVIRTKNYANVEVGGVIARIPFKPKFKPKKLLEIKKIFPVGMTEEHCIDTSYDLKISLPSGLMITSEPGLHKKPFHIKQSYILKGPQSKCIEEEEWRVVLRNGCVVIKKLDGTVLVYTMNGTVIKYDVPYFDHYKDVKYKYKIPGGKEYKHQRLRLKKMFKQTMRRRIKHMIHGPEEYYNRSRNQFFRFHKKRIKPNAVYLAACSNEFIYPKYIVISPNGKKIKVVRGKITEEKPIFIFKDSDILEGEEIYEREDGTQCLYKNDGTNIIQFTDGTRLRSFFLMKGTEEGMDDDFIEEEEEVSKPMNYDAQDLQDILEEHNYLSNSEKLNLLYKKLAHLDPEQKKAIIKDVISNMIDGLSVSSLGESSTSSEVSMDVSKKSETVIEKKKEKSPEVVAYKEYKKSLNEWSIVHLYCEVQHPNYATITYNSIDEEMSIILPGNITINSLGNKGYHLDLGNKVTAEVSKKEIKLQSVLCPNCPKKTTASIHIKHLYDNNPIIPIGELLLQCCDTYNKMFRVDYQGNSMRNNNYQKDNPCQKHLIRPAYKLYSMKRNLSGFYFWNENMMDKRLYEADTMGDQVFKYIQEEKTTYEIRSDKSEYYCNRFVTPYELPKLYLKEYQPKKEQKGILYSTKRLLHSLIDSNSLDNIFNCLDQDKDLTLNRKSFLDSPSKSSLFKTSVEESKQPTLNESKEMEAAISMMEKWRQWKARMDTLWKELKSGYIPKYPYPVEEKVKEEEIEEIPKKTFEDVGVNTDLDPYVNKRCPLEVVEEEEQGWYPKYANYPSDDKKEDTKSSNKTVTLKRNSGEEEDECDPEAVLSDVYENYKRPFGSHENLFGFEPEQTYDKDEEDKADVGSLGSIGISYRNRLRGIAPSMVVIRSKHSLTSEESSSRGSEEGESKSSDPYGVFKSVFKDERSALERLAGKDIMSRSSDEGLEMPEDTATSSKSASNSPSTKSLSVSLESDSLFGDETENFVHKRTSSMRVCYVHESKTEKPLRKLSSRLSFTSNTEGAEIYEHGRSPSLFVFSSNMDVEKTQEYILCTCDVGCQTTECPDACTQTEMVQ